MHATEKNGKYGITLKNVKGEAKGPGLLEFRRRVQRKKIGKMIEVVLMAVVGKAMFQILEDSREERSSKVRFGGTTTA